MYEDNCLTEKVYPILQKVCVDHGYGPVLRRPYHHLRVGAAADFALHHQCGHERSGVPDSTDGGDHRGAVFCPAGH